MTEVGIEDIESSRKEDEISLIVVNTEACCNNMDLEGSGTSLVIAKTEDSTSADEVGSSGNKGEIVREEKSMERVGSS